MPGHLGELTQYLPFELVDAVLEQTRTGPGPACRLSTNRVNVALRPASEGRHIRQEGLRTGIDMGMGLVWVIRYRPLAFSGAG